MSIFQFSSRNLDEDLFDIWKTVKIGYSFLSSEGILTVISVAQIPELEEVDSLELTIFDNLLAKESEAETNTNKKSQKLFGVFKTGNMRVILFVVKSPEEETQLVESLHCQEEMAKNKKNKKFQKQATRK